jgi:hypothetical protein
VLKTRTGGIWNWDEVMLIADHRGKIVLLHWRKPLCQVENNGSHVTYIAALTGVGPVAAGIPPTVMMPAIQRKVLEKELAKLIGGSC